MAHRTLLLHLQYPFLFVLYGPNILNYTRPLKLWRDKFQDLCSYNCQPFSVSLIPYHLLLFEGIIHKDWCWGKKVRPRNQIRFSIPGSFESERAGCARLSCSFSLMEKDDRVFLPFLQASYMLESPVQQE